MDQDLISDVRDGSYDRKIPLFFQSFTFYHAGV
jgi:hypothetical protein